MGELRLEADLCNATSESIWNGDALYSEFRYRRDRTELQSGKPILQYSFHA